MELDFCKPFVHYLLVKGEITCVLGHVFEWLVNIIKETIRYKHVQSTKTGYMWTITLLKVKS